MSLAPSGGYYLVSSGTYVWTTFANFTSSKLPPEALIRYVKRFKFVEQVKVIKIGEVALDHFLFPVVVAGKFRAVIMSLDPLLRVEQRLSEEFGSAGPVLMYEEGKQYGIDNVRQLRDLIPKSDPDTLLAALVSWLRTTGWSIFEFDNSELEALGKIRVTVKEPPNAGISGISESHFTNGTTAGILESVYERTVRLTSSIYDESRRTLTLVFETSSYPRQQ